MRGLRDAKIWAIIKNKGTPTLLNSSDNIDGTQTFLTQLSAVKPTSSEKTGKIQTNKMTKFAHLFNKNGSQSTMTSNSLLQWASIFDHK